VHRLPALLSGIFAIALFTGSAHAAERVALIIGNAKYQHLGTLKHPARDAEAMAAALRSLGFGSVTVVVDAPRQKMLDALRDFGREAERAEWATIFYAGHGLEVRGVTYLVPIDAKLETDRDVELEAVTLHLPLKAITPKKFRLIIYDAGRDNPFAVKGRDTRARADAVDIATPDTPTLIAYATKAGQIGQEGDGESSPFTAALIKNIATPGLDIRILFARVRDDVSAATNRRQQPFTYGALPAESLSFVPK
jgi:uncharacterized caspase-like protein